MTARELQSRAQDMASANLDRRLVEMNELRKQIDNERGRYLSRVEYESKHEMLAQRLSVMETQFAGMLGRMAMLAAIAGLVVSIVVSVLLKLANL